MSEYSEDLMAEYSVRVTSKVGCLDKVADTLTKTGAQINSLACACQGGDGFATFSLAKSVKLDIADAKETGISVLHVNVRNEAGCLSRVTSALSQAGVAIGSLACACAPGDVSGTVAVSLLARK